MSILVLIFDLINLDLLPLNLLLDLPVFELFVLNSPLHVFDLLHQGFLVNMFLTGQTNYLMVQLVQHF